jgi:cysteine desulfurase
VRFSLGIYNTDEEIDYLLKHLPRVIGKLREDSPHKPGTGHASPVAHANRPD